MVEVDNLYRTGKIWIGRSPDPFGSVTDDNLFGCAIPSAGPGFQIETFAKLFGGFNGAGVGGGIRIADRISLLVPCGLSKNTSQLGFPRVRSEERTVAKK